MNTFGRRSICPPTRWSQPRQHRVLVQFRRQKPAGAMGCCKYLKWCRQVIAYWVWSGSSDQTTGAASRSALQFVRRLRPYRQLAGRRHKSCQPKIRRLRSAPPVLECGAFGLFRFVFVQICSGFEIGWMPICQCWTSFSHKCQSSPFRNSCDLLIARSFLGQCGVWCWGCRLWQGNNIAPNSKLAPKICWFRRRNSNQMKLRNVQAIVGPTAEGY